MSRSSAPGRQQQLGHTPSPPRRFRRRSPSPPPRRPRHRAGTVTERVIEKSTSTVVYPVLGRNDYTDWSLVMKVNLQAAELWDVIESGDGDFPTDRKALAALLRAVPQEMRAGLAVKETARDYVRRIGDLVGDAFILTKRDYVRRIGDLVGDASDTGRVKNVELEILTEMRCSTGEDAQLMVSYSQRFRDFLEDCPAAFRSLTRLTLEFLWFEDQDALRDLVRGCDALEFLSLKFCGLFRPRSPDLDDDIIRPAVLTIDVPRSRLKTLVCDHCYIERVELVQAPALVELQHRWYFDDHPPISFGCVPALRSLSLTHHPHRHQDDDDDVIKWKLSELLARDGNQIQTLRFDFENDEIWLQPEPPRKLRAALGGLKELHLTKIPPGPGYNLSWALFLLGASPLLESLDIHIADHICRGEWRKRRGENTNLTWQPPSPGFVHHNLKKLAFRRAFNVYKDMRFARLIMELAVNLETLTFGVKTLECKDCVAAELNFPDPARPRLRLPGNREHVDALEKKLKDGISTSALITIILPD